MKLLATIITLLFVYILTVHGQDFEFVSLKEDGWIVHNFETTTAEAASLSQVQVSPFDFNVIISGYSDGGLPTEAAIVSDRVGVAGCLDPLDFGAILWSEQYDWGTTGDSTKFNHHDIRRYNGHIYLCGTSTAVDGLTQIGTTDSFVMRVAGNSGDIIGAKYSYGVASESWECSQVVYDPVADQVFSLSESTGSAPVLTKMTDALTSPIEIVLHEGSIGLGDARLFYDATSSLLYTALTSTNSSITSTNSYPGVQSTLLTARDVDELTLIAEAHWIGSGDDTTIISDFTCDIVDDSPNVCYTVTEVGSPVSALNVTATALGNSPLFSLSWGITMPYRSVHRIARPIHVPTPLMLAGATNTSIDAIPYFGYIDVEEGQVVGEEFIEGVPAVFQAFDQDDFNGRIYCAGYSTNEPISNADNEGWESIRSSTSTTEIDPFVVRVNAGISLGPIDGGSSLTTGDEDASPISIVTVLIIGLAIGIVIIIAAVIFITNKKETVGSVSSKPQQVKDEKV